MKTIEINKKSEKIVEKLYQLFYDQGFIVEMVVYRPSKRKSFKTLFVTKSDFSKMFKETK